MTKRTFLYLTILIEGYVVLSAELLAIRLLMPFVGSGVEVIAIIISGILLPLAVGYHFGGRAFQKRYEKARAAGLRPPFPRELVLRNLFLSLVILAFGLTYLFLDFFFTFIAAMGATHRLAQAALYSALFLVVPTFLLGQTVPLISNYFSRRKLSEITGKMLFFSTAGSFLGSLCSTLILMTFFGVHVAVIVTLALVCLLCLLLGGRRRSSEAVYAVVVMLFVLLLNSGLNSGLAVPSQHIYSNNAYNMVQIFDLDKEGTKLMSANRSASSKVSPDPGQRFAYIAYIEDNFIAPLNDKKNPRDILVIGAGGFTMGQHDSINAYTFVDIDPDLKKVSEEHFLPEKLSPNKRFVPASARAFLRNDTSRYDLILIDVYNMVHSIPVECVTREFLQDVKAHLKPEGIVAANIIMSPSFGDKFAVRYNNTFASVFPVFSRQIMQVIDPWKKDSIRSDYANVIYIYFQNSLIGDRGVYTDDKNSYSLDQK